jgi:hypothetical protein
MPQLFTPFIHYLAIFICVNCIEHIVIDLENTYVAKLEKACFPEAYILIGGGKSQIMTSVNDFRLC